MAMHVIYDSESNREDGAAGGRGRWNRNPVLYPACAGKKLTMKEA